ncbi:MAG: calcium/sodium antiporter [Candidatus Krumholzibacteria bacterium]|nr:calcium/sodium antiporter [Candidatus Krumholzibacteria bacterium]
MLPIAGLIAGFVLIVKGADWLIAGSSSLARRLRVSDYFIGLTVVAFGTSMPELSVNLYAGVTGSADIAIGNIIGSNIFNIWVILGIASCIWPLAITKSTVWKEIPFSLLAAVLLGAVANDALFEGAERSTIGRIDAFVLLSLFIIFIYYLISGCRSSEEPGDPDTVGALSNRRTLMLIGAGLAGLVVGSRLVVDGAQYAAMKLGVSETFIGLTIVGAGTSAPELATSVMAAYRRNADIAVGNIVGSNIFNVFFILGVTGLIRPLPVDSRVNADILALVAASLLLFFFMFMGRRHLIDRWKGLAFLAMYAAYLVFLVGRG